MSLVPVGAFGLGLAIGVAGTYFWTQGTSTQSQVRLDVESAESNEPVKGNDSDPIDTPEKNINIAKSMVQPKPTETPKREFIDPSLKAEVARLRNQIDRLQAELMAQKPMPDMLTMMREAYELESRDAQFADETELQISDFVYQFGFNDHIKLDLVGCKTTVCEFTFAPRNPEQFDTKLWRDVADRLFEMPWWSKFKATTSRSSDDSLNIWVTTTWQEPKPTAQ
ncbi:hypothetical protein PALB_7400 [Pseudoalteromonas luteoviolacea B = ATCC 29581]|nr:hypothetical protein PALB_7400 [Pseudoalteromonas luteoviolacea B = ATCC 29581]